MNLDREWMYNRGTGCYFDPEFEEKVNAFVDFAMSHPECMDGNKIKCPCSKCQNKPYLDRDSVVYHIVSNGFKSDYHRWLLHGEYVFEGGQETSGTSYYNNENMYGNDSFGQSGYDDSSRDIPGVLSPNTCDRYKDMIMDAAGPSFEYHENDPELPNPNAKKFYDAIRAQQTPLYDGCGHSTFSAVTRLTNIKAESGLSEKYYDRIAKLMYEVMLEGNRMPQTFYETKKIVEPLGMPVEKIDCCSSGCMLYWGEDSERTTCKICNQPKGGKNSVMWYFPLTPRLQRLYASEATAKHMRWHAEHESDPCVVTHPSDSKAWKHFNNTHQQFAYETRNVRLALSSDGFMPFGQYGKQYSSWPVILNPYNLPPGMFTKEQFMFLTVLIPVPRDPSQKLDVYLQPLIAELNNLWNNGSWSYDSSMKQNFMMRAALMWTISDFPAYAMLSGWSTKGQLACPICMEDSDSWYLPKGHKQTWFDNHRKFLPRNHAFRKDTNGFIKNTRVTKMAPRPKTGVEILQEIDQMGLMKITEHDSEVNNIKVKKHNDGYGWKKRSIFWDLSYWKTNLIRHNLDVMHIEKICFENIFNTVMDIKGKTKDNDNSRLDLKIFCTRPTQDKDANGVYHPPKYRLNKKQREAFLKWEKCIKFPDGCVSNMSRCVEANKYRAGGMKSHDCHVFMQRLVPIAFQKLLDKTVWEALTELSLFFRELTCTTLRVADMERLEKDIPVIICKLEKIFPPSFFDPMEHLVVHLATEAKLAGPVQGRWMYPYERNLKNKKRNIRNKARVEGSIGNAYLTDEISNFGSLYFEPEVYAGTRKVPRNDDRGEKEVVPGNLSIFTYPGRTSGKPTKRILDEKEYHVASTYILLNCPEAKPYVNIYTNWLREVKHIQTEAEIDECLDTYFREWFRDYVDEDAARINHDPFLLSLSQGPLSKKIKSYRIYFVNGYKFQTMKHGAKRETVNSGVCLKSDYDDFYGNISEILEFEYPRLPIKKTVLFKCEWFDNSTKGTRYHKCYKLVDVNIDSRYAKHDPFILASQAMQVCYISYPSLNSRNKQWRAVCKVNARAVVHLPELQTTEQPTSAFQDDDTIGHSILNIENLQPGPLADVNHDPDFEIDLDKEYEEPQVVPEFTDSSEDENELSHDKDDIGINDDEDEEE